MNFSDVVNEVNYKNPVNLGVLRDDDVPLPRVGWLLPMSMAANANASPEVQNFYSIYYNEFRFYYIFSILLNFFI